MDQVRTVRDVPAGYSRDDFSRIGRNGMGDQLNAYPHSMFWYRDRLYVGTTRSNLCLFRVSKIQKNVETWPVECPDYLYDQDMRAQIWRWDPAKATGEENSGWEMTAQSPLVKSGDEILPRELGYRGMCTFQANGEDTEYLYVATYAPARAYGTRILRTDNGEDFEEVPLPKGFDRAIITTRLLIPFKGKLFTSPTGRADGQPNVSGEAVIFATDDPMSGKWELVNTPGFNDPTNLGVFELLGCGDYLYAGTANLNGYQIWRTKAEGPLPYEWERVVLVGAYRGPLNQCVASLCAHNGVLYAGGGIQHGGIDVENGVGPASPELIRIHPDASWDLVCGTTRMTPDGFKPALSGYRPGFNNLFCGYFWRMASHDGWLYLGTFDWSLMMRYADPQKWPGPFRRMVDKVGIESLIENQSGADLMRSRDGENWVPVTRNGFDNPYNYGIRTMASTPHGLAVGLVNPFGPRVGVHEKDGFRYEHNPDGGAEVWLGSKAPLI